MIITKHEQFVQRIQKQYGHIIDLFQINKETLGVITNKSKCYIHYNYIVFVQSKNKSAYIFFWKISLLFLPGLVLTFDVSDSCRMVKVFDHKPWLKKCLGMKER